MEKIGVWFQEGAGVTGARGPSSPAHCLPDAANGAVCMMPACACTASGKCAWQRRRAVRVLECASCFLFQGGTLHSAFSRIRGGRKPHVAAKQRCVAIEPPHVHGGARGARQPLRAWEIVLLCALTVAAADQATNDHRPSARLGRHSSMSSITARHLLGSCRCAHARGARAAAHWAGLCSPLHCPPPALTAAMQLPSVEAAADSEECLLP